jgi:hypothetical protein
MKDKHMGITLILSGTALNFIQGIPPLVIVGCVLGGLAWLEVMK